MKAREICLLSAAVAGLCAAILATACGRPADAGKIVFEDVRSQTEEFIAYNHTIELTPEQELVKRLALSAIPAPCCSDNSAYTCCCPCNMAKANWGLSNYLIAELGYDVEQVRETVGEWIEFINPAGYSGDVCYTAGGCMRAFKHNGCGGMRESEPVFAD